MPRHRREIETKEPDPGEDGAYFFSWLLKRNAVKPYQYCKKRWKDINLDALLKRVGPKIARKCKSSDGQKVIWLVDTVWASQWAMKYGCDYPHHRQRKSIEK